MPNLLQIIMYLIEKIKWQSKLMQKQHKRYMSRGNNIARKTLSFLNPNQVVENYFTEVA